MDSAGDDGRSKTQRHEKNNDHCVICLHEWEDKSVLETCQHAFCFKCLFQWAMVARSCPLCVRPFESCIHLIASDNEYTVHHFEPLETSKSVSSQPSLTNADSNTGSSSHGIIRRLYGPPQLRPRFSHQHPRNHPRPAPRETPEERSVAEQQRSALEKRVHIYRHGLYVKHMGANRISRYQQTTPETFQIFPARLDRLAPWIRRELQAITWLLTTRGIASGQNVPSPSSSSSSSPSLGSVADDDGLLRDEVAPGLEVVREYILAVMKQYDLQTDPAMDLLQGFLHEYTEHFVHELMAYARSPFSIEAYDQAAQYSSATAASQQSRGSPTPSFQRQSRSCDSTRLSFRDGDGGRGKRRRDSTAGEERMESRQNRHGKSVRRGGRDDVDGGAAQDNSEKGKAEGIATSSRIPRDDGHSSGLPSCTIASSSSSKPQLSSSEQMQRLIREKLAREKAIYDKNHPS